MRARDAVRTLEAVAPAKLNLGLRVGARRPDGYHEIESLFAPLDWGDRIRLAIEDSDEPAVSLRLSGAGPDVPADASNLAARAARAFLDATGLPFALEIALHKQIPSGAGLGGGSSDAGTLLALLARTWPEALSAERLRELGLALGADVPFFLAPRPARVTGVGERIEPLVDLPPLGLLLAAPDARLATAEVYRAFDALVPAPAPSPLPDPRGLAAGAPGDWPERLRNDLWPAAIRLCPAIRRLREALDGLGPIASGLSGSGPTLYGLFPDRAAAERAQGSLGARGGAAWTRVASFREAG